LSLQLKCAYLVLAKAPLPEEAIFNRNKAVAERQRAACKAQHKERQIAKRDRKDNHIKRRKAGERGVSSDEDPSLEPLWSSDVPSAAVDWSDISGSSSSSPPRATEVSSLWRPQTAVCDKTLARPRDQRLALPREDQQTVCTRVVPSKTGASKSQKAAPAKLTPPKAVVGATSFCPPTFRWFRPPRLGLPTEASVAARSTDSTLAPSAPSAVDSGTAPRSPGRSRFAHR
jgi:hypothetical protein